MGILPFETAWIDLEDIVLREMSQAEKGKYCIISLICRVYKNHNKEQKQTNTDSKGKNKLIAARGEGVGGCVRKVTGNTVNNKAITLHSDR